MPIGVVIAATIAGLISVVTLIVSKENKISENRQAWIDAQRADVADVIAAATQLEVASRDDRAKLLAEFDRAFTRIKLRDNPKRSASREEIPHKWKYIQRSDRKKPWKLIELERKYAEPFPWRVVTEPLAALRLELEESRHGPQYVSKLKDDAITQAQLLLKVEWDIVKDGEEWYSLTRHIFKLVITIVLTFAAILFLWLA